MKISEHTLEPVEVPSGRNGIDARTTYFVVQDISVTSAPPPSGVLLRQIQDAATPEWIRELFVPPSASSEIRRD
jgi:hypothetical protein